jgi:hypothetical protein
MPKSEIDYTNVYIYKLCCRDISIKDIYVGHTTNFEQRKSQHKKSCEKNHKTRVYKFIRENGGWENWTMILIEKKSFNNKIEACAKERYWIEALEAKLNCNNPIATKEEKEQQKKDWYEENKEIILQKTKEHYEENKDKKIEYQKEYSKENKEQITKYQKEYRVKNKDKLAEQKKEYRVYHKDEASKSQKEWRELNKDKIKEKNSEIIICSCGGQYTFNNKNRHFQTQKHINNTNTICGSILETKDKTSIEKNLSNTKQKQKEYRKKNAEKIKESKKIYNDIHKEENKIQSKKYYYENKNQIIEKNKIYAEENKNKIKKMAQDRYQKNKEKILVKQSQLYICCCGSEIRISGKAEHNRSIKHLDYIKSNKLDENNNIETIISL